MPPNRPRPTGLRALLSQPAPMVAPALLGWTITCHGVTGTIVETEAYQSEQDLACHASRGRTARTETLYRQAGTLYVYLCYGLHHLLNLVCDAEGVPAAVLIRAIDITGGEDLARQRRHQARGRRELLANGPGKVAQALALDRSHDRTVIGAAGCPLNLAPGPRPAQVAAGPRVGVAYAGEWADRPWRWWVAGYPVA